MSIPKHQRMAHGFAWPATFELLNLLRPVITEEQAAEFFGPVYEHFKTIISDALVAQERERQRLNGAAS
jgi:hypothetical protein